MIVDRFPEVEKYIKYHYNSELDEKDPSFPFFKKVQEISESLWTFEEMLNEYKSKIIYFFSIVDEGTRSKAVEEAFLFRDKVKKKMNEIKLCLNKIKNEFVIVSTPKNNNAKKNKNKKRQKNVEINELYQIQHRFIVSSYLKKCELFFSIEKDFRKRKEEEVIRRMKIFSQDEIDEEELKTMIYKGADYHKVQELYKKQTFKIVDSQQKSLSIEMSGLKQTNEELNELEKDMNEIMEMFQDMFILTNLLDDPINNIYFMIEKANESILRTQRKIHSSKKKQRGYSPKCSVM